MIGHESVLKARLKGVPVRLVDLDCYQPGHCDLLPNDVGMSLGVGRVYITETPAEIEKLDLRLVAGAIVTILAPDGDSRVVPLLMRATQFKPLSVVALLPDAVVQWDRAGGVNEFPRSPA